jgi:ribosomal 50S subunit-associated protein YjgA (DUF615 family)
MGSVDWVGSRERLPRDGALAIARLRMRFPGADGDELRSLIKALDC